MEEWQFHTLMGLGLMAMILLAPIVKTGQTETTISSIFFWWGFYKFVTAKEKYKGKSVYSN